MALQVNITNISQVTYPVDVYVCSGCPDNNCTLVDTINSVPSTITIPGPYSGYSSFGVKIIDNKDCEYCQTFQGTTTTSTTSTTTINPICLSCDIGFDFYNQNPIAEISVGLVTASCDPSIIDYVIDWYGPGVGSTNVEFTSGYGSEYNGEYLYPHPLTGSSSVPVVAGVYTPIIRKIKLNGIEYTDVNCFQSTTVDVDALTCENGDGSDDPNYSHKLEFNATVGQTPQPVTTTFVLDPTKPYFAYSFKGEQIYDDLKITFFGSDYPDPIVLEYISIGVNQTETNFNLSINPKTIKTGGPNVYFPKVLCLTGLTVNNGDYLEIEITPNPDNNNTNWDFYCECLETFNCDICYDTTVPPIKIIESSIALLSFPCDGFNVIFNYSGCDNSDIYKYLNPKANGLNNISETAYNNFLNQIYNGVKVFSTPFLYYLPTTYCTNVINLIHQTICDTPSTSTIIYEKSVVLGEGLIEMTFNAYSDLETYYNSWDEFFTNYGGSPTNPLDIDYYRFFNLKIPLAIGSEQCGDLTGYQDFYIHPSSIVTTGGTGPWTMTLTMPTITNSLSWTSCDVNCISNTNFLINEINNSSTGITNNINITNNVGSKLVYPFTQFKYLTSATTTDSSYIYERRIEIPIYVNQTIPYSGSPLTIIPSLSAITCDLSSFSILNYSPTKNTSAYARTMIYWDIRIVSLTGDFEIWTYDIANNTAPTPPYFKIYENIGGVPNVIDPNYFI